MGRLATEGQASLHVSASPSTIWAIVTDPTRLGEWTAEMSDADWTGRWNRAEMGARFIGATRVGRFGADRTGEVVEVDEVSSFGWRILPTAISPESTLWRVTLEPADDGTIVEWSFEMLRLNPVIDRLLHRFAPQRRHRADSLPDDLQRLALLANPSTTPTV